MVGLLTGAAGFLSPGVLGLAILYAGAICRKFGSKLSVASQSGKGSLLLVSGVLAALWCYALWAFHLASVTAPRCRSCEDAAAEPHISLEWSASDDFPEDFAPLLALKQLLFVGEGISGAKPDQRHAREAKAQCGVMHSKWRTRSRCCFCILGLALLLSFWISGLGINLWPSRVSLVDNDFYELKLQDNTDLADLLSMYSNVSSDEPSVQSMRAGEQNGLFAVSGALRLAHGALKVFTWLTDAKESEKVFSEHVQSCNSRRLLAERGSQKLVEVSKTGRWRLLGIPFSFESTVTVLEDWRDYKATFRQKKRGAMNHFAGFWQVVPVSTEESVVLLYTEAVPGFPVPSLLRRFARVVVEDMACLTWNCKLKGALVEELKLEGQVDLRPGRPELSAATCVQNHEAVIGPQQDYHKHNQPIPDLPEVPITSHRQVSSKSKLELSVSSAGKRRCQLVLHAKPPTPQHEAVATRLQLDLSAACHQTLLAFAQTQAWSPTGWRCRGPRQHLGALAFDSCARAPLHYDLGGDSRHPARNMEGIEGSLLPLHSELKLEDAISVLKFRQTLREESEEFPRPRSVDPASAAVASMPPEELSGLLEDSWRSAESRRPFTTPGASRPHGLSRSNTCNSSFSISGSDILRPKSIIIDEPIPSRLVNMLKQASDFERQSREKSSASRRSLFTQSCGSLRSKANLSSSRLGRARSLRQQTSRVLESRMTSKSLTGSVAPVCFRKPSLNFDHIQTLFCCIFRACIMASVAAPPLLSRPAILSVGPASERGKAAAVSESARSGHGFQLFSGYLLSHMLWRRWRRQESRPAVCVAASKLSILEAGSRLQQSARELIKKNGQGIVFSYPLCFGLNACICLVLGGTSYVWTRRCRPLVLCPFHVDSKLFGYFTAIYLSYGTLCYPLQLGAAVALAPKFSRSFRALKSRMGLNWFMAGAWLLALIAASLTAVMAGIVFALALWPGGRRPPGPRHGWPRTIGGGRLPEIKGCISDTEKQKVKELPKSSASTRPKKHSGPQDVSLEAACAFWNIATPAEERRAQQARRNTSKDSSKGAKYSGEDAVSRVLNAGPGAPELARAVGLPVQVAKEAASLFRRFGNIPSKGSLFQGKLQMSRLPEVLVALCDVTEISEISEAFVDWALKAADRDSSSSMDVQEFAIWYSSFCFAEEVTVKPEVRETRELARQMGLEIGQIEQFKVAFDRYDEDGSGEIEFEEFSNMVQELLKIPHGQELPHDRLMTMWRSADMQQKGCLDFREFCFFYFRMGATGQGSDPIADYYRNVRHVPVAP
eukprot:s122_g10.t4